MALCAAEMATVKGWEKRRCLYLSVGHWENDLDLPLSFFQWFEITVGYLTMLYFLTGALSYATGIDAIQNNKFLKLAILLIIFRAILLSQLKRNQIHFFNCSNRFCSWDLLPALVLFGLGIHYVSSGAPLQTTLSMKTLIPDFSKLPTLVVLFPLF